MRLVCPRCQEEKTARCVECLGEYLIKDPVVSEVVVIIEGGNVQDAITNDPDISIIIVDKDNERAGDTPTEIPEWCKRIINQS